MSLNFFSRTFFLGITAGLALLSPVSVQAETLARTSRDAVLAQAAAPANSLCPPSALSRFSRHRVQAGETLDAIAQQNNLVTATLLRLNPNLPSGRLPVGQEIVVPPYNGIVVTVPRGQSWDQVASQYESRADVLFEINGCQATVPERIFVPGLNWLTRLAPTASNASGSNSRASNPLKGYPLPQEAEILTTYGWQPDPTTQKLVFNTGVSLAANPGTPALVVGEGTVAFAGEDAVYGNLVVINHQQGLQTRYANLASVSVAVGQSIKQGTSVGFVADPSSGETSFLFFEVRLNSDRGWIAQDPQDYIPALIIR
ncbi:MAG TPA: M23 family metallopeptidase [Trichocoleus sp.]